MFVPNGGALGPLTPDRSAGWRTEVYVSTDPSTNDHTVQVLTGNNGAASNQPFHLIVL
ncbi:hypothetical protein [Streptomyces sp. NPDC047718]|uniref:hypothetical protein n=1 Tax=Streptomyces sp. NPDC047718 TaxID=3155479 RepID=UPI0033CF706F